METSSPAPTPDEATANFDDVVRSLKTMTKHLGADAADAMSKTAVALAHSAVQLAEEARAKSKTLAAKAEQEIREHPAATAALAAAAVALIGLAMSTRRAGADPAP